MSKSKTPARKRPTIRTRYVGLRKQIANATRITPIAVTGDAVPEPFVHLWRAFTPTERIYVWAMALAAVNARPRRRKEGGR